jgi:hypothetical protein
MESSTVPILETTVLWHLGAPMIEQTHQPWRINCYQELNENTFLPRPITDELISVDNRGYGKKNLVSSKHFLFCPLLSSPLLFSCMVLFFSPLLSYFLLSRFVFISLLPFLFAPNVSFSLFSSLLSFPSLLSFSLFSF